MRLDDGTEITENILVDRWGSIRPFVVIGSASTIGGGLVAAVTGPTEFELGAWLAAFLVLVGGAAQIALGAGQAWLADAPPSPRVVRAETWAWNIGVLGTTVGTLTSTPVVTTVGGGATVVALVLFIAGVRRSSSAPGWALLAYRSVAWVVLLSTPVGLTLAWVRHT